MDSMVEKLDKALTAAFRQVAVPDGLADRLLARLEKSRDGAPADEPVAGTLADHPVQLPVKGSVWARRPRLAATGGLVALAAGVLWAFFIVGSWQPAGSDLDYDAVMQMAGDFQGQDVGRNSGRSAKEAPPPNAYPIGDFLAAADVRWRPVKRFLGRKGVAYDLRGRGGARATVYVVNLVGSPNLSDLPSGPTQNPLTTGGRTTAAWIEGERLYVIVVDGGLQDYRGFLRASGPLA